MRRPRGTRMSLSCPSLARAPVARAIRRGVATTSPWPYPAKGSVRRRFVSAGAGAAVIWAAAAVSASAFAPSAARGSRNRRCTTRRARGPGPACRGASGPADRRVPRRACLAVAADATVGQTHTLKGRPLVSPFAAQRGDGGDELEGRPRRIESVPRAVEQVIGRGVVSPLRSKWLRPRIAGGCEESPGMGSMTTAAARPTRTPSARIPGRARHRDLQPLRRWSASNRGCA